jgi:hypothetical protein
MTHPLRYKKPYAPKVGEWWETDKYGLCTIIDATDKTTVLQQLEPSDKIFFGNKLIAINKSTNFIRRHFRGQAERDAAPAIPPVEGAMMLSRRAAPKATEVIRKDPSSAVKWGYKPQLANKCCYTDGRNSWCPRGKNIVWYDGKSGDKTNDFDIIAVHTWPEDIKDEN